MSGKFELVCSVLRIKRYALIAAVSAACLGVIYYFLTMSMLSAHLGAVQGSVPYIAASVGLTAAVSALAGVNFAMMAYKIKRMRMMNSVKSTLINHTGRRLCRIHPGMSRMYGPAGRDPGSSRGPVAVSAAGAGTKACLSRRIGVLGLLDCPRTAEPQLLQD